MALRIQEAGLGGGGPEHIPLEPGEARDDVGDEGRIKKTALMIAIAKIPSLNASVRAVSRSSNRSGLIR